MVDDFMVCVDRVLKTACFDSVENGGLSRAGAERGENSSASGGAAEKGDGEGSLKKSQKGKMAECRICQEEDDEQEMEAPCACSGTLKFAHRKCIQRWCNKKGNITCEICNQSFAPNYSLPPPRPSSDGMVIDIRRSWGPSIELHDPRILALAAEHRLLHAEYDDYTAVNNNSIACVRAFTLVLMLLLLVHHALAVTKETGFLQDVSAFYNVSFNLLALFYHAMSSCV